MKSIVKFLVTVFIISAALFQSSCGGGGQQTESKDGELKGTISISGAFALYPLTVKWA